MENISRVGITHTIESPASQNATAAPGDLSMQEALAAAAVDRGSMSSAEYRSYILDKISSIPIHPSQSLASISVHISEEGFEAMQADPEYEAWVLGRLEYDFSFNDVWGPLCGGSYIVHTFGATKEEYHGESWFPGYNGGRGASLFEKKSAGSIWNRNTQKRASLSKGEDKYGELSARLRMERMLRKLAIERRQIQSDLLASASRRRAMIEAQHASGHQQELPSAPLPQLKGVSASYLLAMLGNGI